MSAHCSSAIRFSAIVVRVIGAGGLLLRVIENALCDVRLYLERYAGIAADPDTYQISPADVSKDAPVPGRSSKERESERAREPTA